MAAEERDSTADWIVPAERRPPSAFELQRQIEVASAVASAAEEAVTEIGRASLEAAEQARRAAAHAERSAEASVAAARAAAAAVGPSGDGDDPIRPETSATAPGADRVASPGIPTAGPDAEAGADGRLRPGASATGSDETGRRPDPARSGGGDESSGIGAGLPGHEEIPGSELPTGWSPVADPPAQIPLRAPSSSSTRRPPAQPDAFDERMVAFRERAERVMARLRALEASG